MTVTPRNAPQGTGKAVFPTPAVLPTTKTAASSRHPGRRRFIAGLGVIVLLASSVGGTYVLILGGVRIPFISRYVTGLPSAGKTLAAEAAVALNALPTYSYTGTARVAALGSNDRPTLPDGSTAAVTPITSFKVTLTEATVAADAFTAAFQLSVNDRAAVSGAAEATATTWYLSITPESEAMAASVQSIARSVVKQSLLYPALHSLTPEAVLAAVSSESSYQKLTGADSDGVEYGYQLDPSALGEWLPDGVTQQQGTATVQYRFHEVKPTSITYQVRFTYAGTTYQYDGSQAGFQYGANESPSAAFTVLSQGKAAAVAGTFSSFVQYLGVSNLAALPHTYDPSAAVVSPSPTPVPSPSATATAIPSSTPSATPTATPVPAITPTGTTITQVEAAVTGSPVVPARTVSSAALQRDQQRKHDLADLQTALTRYHTANGSYPTVRTVEQTIASSTLLSALVPTYLTAMPVDPLPHTYWYEYRSVDGRSYTLRTVAENWSDTEARRGAEYPYFERAGNGTR